MRSHLSPFGRCLFALAAFAVAASGCHPPQDSLAKPSCPNVQVARPTVRPVIDYVYFTGRIDAPQTVKIQARVTGYLESVGFEEGAPVRAGQRLFLIDPRPYQAALDRANGQVKLAEARLRLARADYARALEIAKTPGAISRQDVDRYAAAEGEAAAAVEAAEATSESARLNVEFTKVLSPIDGVAGRYLLTVGNLIKQDTSLLTTVVSQDPMYAYFDMDEHTLLCVKRLFQEGRVSPREEKEGFPVELGLADEGDRYPHAGLINFVSNQLEATTGTIQVRGTFPNPSLNAKSDRLLTPGMFVRIRLPLGEPEPAMLAPQKAVATDQGNKYLMVVNEQNVAEYRPVTLGPEQPDGLQVVLPVKMVRTRDGLRPVDETTPPGEPTIDSIAPADRVIVSGLQRVRPGQHVAPREAPANVERARPLDGKSSNP